MYLILGRFLMEGSNDDPESATLNPAVAQAIAGLPVEQVIRKSILCVFNLWTFWLFWQTKGKLNSETTRHLLISFLWVLRHVEEASLRNWWSELNPQKLHRLLELLFICTSGFEYRGKRQIRRCVQQRGGRTTEHVKSRLEDLILGQGSARSDMMSRRRGNNSHIVSQNYLYFPLISVRPYTRIK